MIYLCLPHILLTKSSHYPIKLSPSSQIVTKYLNKVVAASVVSIFKPFDQVLAIQSDNNIKYDLTTDEISIIISSTHLGIALQDIDYKGTIMMRNL